MDWPQGFTSNTIPEFLSDGFVVYLFNKNMRSPFFLHQHPRTILSVWMMIPRNALYIITIIGIIISCFCEIFMMIYVYVRPGWLESQKGECGAAALCHPRLFVQGKESCELVASYHRRLDFRCFTCFIFPGFRIHVNPPEISRNRNRFLIKSFWYPQIIKSSMTMTWY